ncbi:hypothetical protein AA313_de0207372 [Arthrobotrys entomopaga]|nr:hypothetical protein AA313_de0207372 [Arthrobotrys entomopaga]
MESFRVDGEVFSMLQSLDVAEVEVFNDLYSASTDDADVELSIYSSALLFRRSGSPHHLEQAIAKAIPWAGATCDNNSEAEYRNNILGMLLSQQDPISTSDSVELNIPDFGPDDSVNEAAVRQITSTRAGLIGLKFFVMFHLRKLAETNDLLRTDRTLRFLRELAAKFSDDTDMQTEVFTGYFLLMQGRLIPPKVPSPGHPPLSELLSMSLDAESLSNSDVSNTDRDKLTRYHLVTDMLMVYIGSLTSAGPGRHLAYETGSLNQFDGETGFLNQFDVFCSSLNKAFEESLAGQQRSRSTFDRNEILFYAGMRFLNRYWIGESVHDLDMAVEHFKLAVEATPVEHSQSLLLYEHTIASTFFLRWMLTDNEVDRNQAIESRETVLFASPDHYQSRETIIQFVTLLLGRYEDTNNISDIDLALNAISSVVENETTEGRRKHLPILDEVVFLLRTKCRDRRPSRDVVKRGLRASQLALDVDPISLDYLEAVANWRSRYADASDDFDDHQSACDAYKTAINTAISQGDHSVHLRLLENLARSVTFMFLKTRDVALLVPVFKMIEYFESTPGPEPKQIGAALVLRASLLSARFRGSGERKDLQLLLELTEKASSLVDPESRDAQILRTTFPGLVATQFQHVRATDDLDRAVKVAYEALENSKMKNGPLSFEDRMKLSTAGYTLTVKYTLTKEVSYVISAVEAQEAAFKSMDESSEYNSTDFLIIYNLANALTLLYEATADTSAAERSVAHFLDILSRPEIPESMAYLGRASLSRMYYSISTRTRDPDYLQLACQSIDEAIDMREHSINPKRGDVFYRGGVNYIRKYTWNNDSRDLDKAVAYFEGGMKTNLSVPTMRLDCAVGAGSELATALHAGRFSDAVDWERPHYFLKAAVEMLPKLNPRSISSEDMQSGLSRNPGLASLAAAVALNAKKTELEAFELLELGRGIIAGLLLDLRTDLSELQSLDPKLAEDFISVREQLDSTGGVLDNTQASSSEIMTVSNRRLHLDQRFEEIISKIRSLEGFKNFLRPSSLDEIKSISDQDPIVMINVSFLRCDAFVIDPRRVRGTGDGDDSILSVVPLPELHEEDVRSKLNEMRQSGIKSSILKWLWDVAANPILTHLKILNKPSSDGDWPHVRWILTGPLSHLPIHAAGDHATENTVLDRVISSYASSVKSLVHNSRRTPANSALPSTPPDQQYNNGTAMMISMKTTPGLPSSDLMYAEEEIKMLKDLCPGLGLKPSTPAARRQDVLQALPDCKIFHFAGHGNTNARDPSQSHLLLNDYQVKPLTMADLRATKLQEKAPFLAYLSACSTSANLVSRLADEGINLANAFQLAGFRHVIGTLWDVSDRYCVRIARVLYETLQERGMNDAAVRWGLHRAVRELRDELIAVETSTMAAIRDLGEPGVSDMEIESAESRASFLVSAKKKRPTRYVEASIRYWAPYIHVGI